MALEGIALRHVFTEIRRQETRILSTVEIHVLIGQQRIGEGQVTAGEHPVQIEDEPIAQEVADGLNVMSEVVAMPRPRPRRPCPPGRS